MSMIENARHRMADLLQRVYFLNKSDAAKEISCLGRRKSCAIDFLIESSMGIMEKMFNRSY